MSSMSIILVYFKILIKFIIELCVFGYVLLMSDIKSTGNTLE